MQIELKIKEILQESTSIDKKANEIHKLMNWDKKEISAAIIKHGTSGKDGRNAIIKEFWGKAKL